MSQKPLVSIVMNCLNGEKYLKKSLDSILNQTYKNWELIFWDNQSSDNSKKILKKYKDKRIKYFYAKKKNTLYKARNLAIKKTKGAFITFLDTDDLWIKNKLEKQVSFFKDNKEAEILYSNYFTLRNFCGLILKTKKYNKILPNGFITNELLKSYYICWATTCFRKTLFKSKKKIFKENYDMIADYEFILRLSIKKKIFSIQEPLAIYRVHPDQLTRRKFFIQIDHFLSWFNFIKKKKVFNHFNNFKILNNKTILFKQLINIERKKFNFFQLLYYFFNGEFKIFLKLIFFIISPKIFIKYLMTTT